MSRGWTLELVTTAGSVELEHLSDDADAWFGDGPAGSSLGGLATVIGAAAGPGVDEEWIVAVHAAVERELRTGGSRVGLLVRRGQGVMFHASRSANRGSIARHGLDWRRMTTRGIAGSGEPERAGIFLCATIEDARWFAAMARDESADVWQVRVDGVWLESDPNASGGLDDCWMVATEAIPAARVSLLAPNVSLDGA